PHRGGDPDSHAHPDPRSRERDGPPRPDAALRAAGPPRRCAPAVPPVRRCPAKGGRGRASARDETPLPGAPSGPAGGPARGAPPPAAPGGPRPRSPLAPPLIGRDAELTRLRDALDAAERGRGRLVVVLGEAGIGKSSLLEALESDASRRGVRGHLGRSYLSES